MQEFSFHALVSFWSKLIQGDEILVKDTRSLVDSCVVSIDTESRTHDIGMIVDENWKQRSSNVRALGPARINVK